MKKVLKVIGIIFLVLIIILVIWRLWYSRILRWEIISSFFNIIPNKQVSEKVVKISDIMNIEVRVWMSTLI